ncbi:MAG TPA: 2-amino-4-hydroxy-6-hydroxymethyldihydropteridine diphosphokinase [Bacteroidales bacterium]
MQVDFEFGMDTSVILILGSNLGDRFKYLQEARLHIDETIGSPIIISSIYETEPWGFTHENLFLNQVIQVNTALGPFEVLDKIQKIETKLGRERGNERYTARTIDIDILFYDDLIINTPKLTIPHIEMSGRRFVLEPLAEIVPMMVHPVYLKTVRELLTECEDRCKVRIAK